MSDETSQRGAQDRQRINMNQEHEVRYWTERFNVSREQLQQAVDAVGSMATSVEQKLKRK